MKRFFIALAATEAHFFYKHGEYAFAMFCAFAIGFIGAQEVLKPADDREGRKS